jgi:hypothetical protein
MAITQDGMIRACAVACLFVLLSGAKQISEANMALRIAERAKAPPAEVHISDDTPFGEALVSVFVVLAARLDPGTAEPFEADARAALRQGGWMVGGALAGLVVLGGLYWRSPRARRRARP